MHICSCLFEKVKPFSHDNVAYLDMLLMKLKHRCPLSISWSSRRDRFSLFADSESNVTVSYRECSDLHTAQVKWQVTEIYHRTTFNIFAHSSAAVNIKGGILTCDDRPHLLKGEGRLYQFRLSYLNARRGEFPEASCIAVFGYLKLNYLSDIIMNGNCTDNDMLYGITVVERSTFALLTLVDNVRGNIIL